MQYNLNEIIFESKMEELSILENHLTTIDESALSDTIKKTVKNLFKTIVKMIRSILNKINNVLDKNYKFRYRVAGGHRFSTKEAEDYIDKVILSIIKSTNSKDRNSDMKAHAYAYGAYTVLFYKPDFDKFIKIIDTVTSNDKIYDLSVPGYKKTVMDLLFPNAPVKMSDFENKTNFNKFVDYFYTELPNDNIMSKNEAEEIKTKLKSYVDRGEDVPTLLSKKFIDLKNELDKRSDKDSDEVHVLQKNLSDNIKFLYNILFTIQDFSDLCAIYATAVISLYNAIEKGELKKSKFYEGAM